MRYVDYNIFDFYDPMLEMIDFMIDEGVIRSKRDKNIFKIADSVEKVFKILEDEK